MYVHLTYEPMTANDNETARYNKHHRHVVDRRRRFITLSKIKIIEIYFFQVKTNQQNLLILRRSINQNQNQNRIVLIILFLTSTSATINHYS
ncbi:hypothetical protein DERP_004931 [Dermatophagoides pteronyssinus]|uniref:Uncharacterized protein n=1 Tax=Dermatophagoides pteronyssinus TaxID=6956 RepID=A0ABQ8JT07_DERPT|nr:hypothetical protein DERP_004931 [Dermatophagoides pteronyssinus]